MFRKIYGELLDWKTQCKGTKALLIEGARRIGKSYIVEKFASSEYKSYVLVDFVAGGDDLRDVKTALSGRMDNPEDFFLALRIYSGKALYERDTLIIFDEVQAFPRAREAIKFLVKDGRYDYIETGSLISIKENTSAIQLPSEERSIRMHPMDFEEFLIAMGQSALWELIVKCWKEKRAMGDSGHQSASRWFRKYLAVGGMPQAVKTFRDTGDMILVDREKRDILKLYANDMIRYGRKHGDRVQRIFDEVPSQLKKHEKKFTFSDVDVKGYAALADDFFWLGDSGMVNIAYAVSEPNIGLDLTREGNVLKCYMGDTGLLVSAAFSDSNRIGSELYRKLLFGKLEFNEGMIVENVVCQMLVAAGHIPYFHSRYSRDAEDRMEIDFLMTAKEVTTRHNIIAIEVKGGENYTFSSLRKFSKKYGSFISEGVIVHDGAYGEKDGFTLIPLYMFPLLCS